MKSKVKKTSHIFTSPRPTAMLAQLESTSVVCTSHLHRNTAIITQSTSQPPSRSCKISLIRCGCGWGGINGSAVEAFLVHVRGHHGINVRLGQVGQSVDGLNLSLNYSNPPNSLPYTSITNHPSVIIQWHWAHCNEWSCQRSNHHGIRLKDLHHLLQHLG